MIDYQNSFQNQAEKPQHYLYADDLLLHTNKKNLLQVIANLKSLSIEYNLIINYKKSGIFFCKQRKINIETYENFPVIKEYKYLGILINNKGNLKNHLKDLKLRTIYLKNSIMKIKENLSLRNKYLLWCVYIRSLYMYTAPIISTQCKSTIQEFKKNWRMGFKNILSLPKNTSNEVLSLIFEDVDKTITHSESKVINKINSRFYFQEW